MKWGVSWHNDCFGSPSLDPRTRLGNHLSSWDLAAPNPSVEAVSLSQFTATLDDLKGQRFHLDGLLGWLQKAVAALGSVGQVRKWIQPRNHGSHRTPKGKALRIFETCLNMVDMSHLWKKASFFLPFPEGLQYRWSHQKQSPTSSDSGSRFSGGIPNCYGFMMP